MGVTTTVAREGSEAPSREPRANSVRRPATDDEILGIEQVPEGAAANPETGRDRIGTQETRLKPARAGREAAKSEELAGRSEADPAITEPENLRAAFDANPELRRAWHDAQAYRETFATPEEARAATALLADLDRMDALFFSGRPEDHAALARAVADLDPAAFASLARAMNGLATETQRPGENQGRAKNLSSATHDGQPPDRREIPRSARDDNEKQTANPTAAQEKFFHATNAAAVQSVVDAIESQVERLLPEGTSKSARNRVVGEIYRELDNTLRSNRQLAQQMREAFRSGALDAEHQRAIVSLIAGRARQALPGVAKRVLNEWTSTVVTANQDRRARQRAAERRVDIAGSNGAGNDGRRPMTPRDIDYARMSDADILNL